MDNKVIIIIISVLALIFFLIMIFSFRNKDKKRIPNYRALFILGIVFLPIGISMDNPGFWVMGLVFLIAGLTNKDKWGKETKWTDLSPKAKKLKLIFLIGLTILLIAVISLYLFSKGKSI